MTTYGGIKNGLSVAGLAVLASLILSGCDAPQRSPSEETVLASPSNDFDDDYPADADEAAGDAAEGDAEEGDEGGESGSEEGAEDDQPGTPVAYSLRMGEIYCDVVRRRTTREQCEQYREEKAALANGVAAFDPPRNMVKGQPTDVRLAIGPEDQRDAVIGQALGDADTAVAPIAIGAKVRIRLIGNAFAIDPTEPIEKAMGGASFGVWSWQVTPQREGEHPLSAQIDILSETGTVLERYPSNLVKVTITISEEEQRRRKRERTVEDLDWYTQLFKLLEDFWWAVVAFIVAVIGGIWQIRRATSGETPEPGDEGEDDSGEGDEDNQDQP
ncbi:MAG: hypothetical protein AAFX04_11450 [Pseudomonadota bacterium]